VSPGLEEWIQMAGNLYRSGQDCMITGFLSIVAEANPHVPQFIR